MKGSMRLAQCSLETEWGESNEVTKEANNLGFSRTESTVVQLGWEVGVAQFGIDAGGEVDWSTRHGSDSPSRLRHASKRVFCCGPSRGRTAGPFETRSCKRLHVRGPPFAPYHPGTLKKSVPQAAVSQSTTMALNNGPSCGFKLCLPD